MKENPELGEAFSLLRRALEIHRYAEFRNRFASVEQWKEEGPYLRKQAYMAWLSAKMVIMNNRDSFDEYIRQNESSLCKSDIENYNSAVKVTVKEMERELENQILKEETMGRKNYEEPILDEDLEEIDELDEDEQYIRETEGRLDEDDVILDQEDDEEF